MKKILFFCFIVLSSYSQTSYHNLLRSLNGVTETNIAKSNRITLSSNEEELNSFNSNKVIEFQKNKDHEVYITPIKISDDLNVYVEIPSIIFNEKKKSMIFNVFGSYLIFNKKTNTLYRIDSQIVCGSVYHKKRNTLVIYSNFKELQPTAFVLDKDLNNVKTYSE